ncbi:hypothetical protein [Methylibium sp.]|uniref:hypothetical protein n=1 Tax=Methylibium sp. TaxID=2067992 RepID=UPI003D0B58BF
MADWNLLADKYAEAAKSVFPLHRLILVILGFLGSIAVQNQSCKSILETIMRWPLRELMFGGDGLLVNAVIADLFAGITLAVIGWMFSYGILRLVYWLAARSVDLPARVVKATEMFAKDTQRDADEIKSLLGLIDSMLEIPRKRLRAFNAGAEFAAGVAACCLVFSYWGNTVDFTAGIVAMFICLALHARAVQVFLEAYLGPALIKSKLLGKSPPAPGDAII